MKKSILILALSASATLLPALSSAEVASLRGAQGLAELSADPEKKKLLVVEGGIERNFKEQPPLVPHEVEKYEITLKNNGCLKCHSEKTYEKEKAPKIGDSHYLDRDGNQLETMSSRRYFCGQCHAPQLKGDPLISNNFEGRK